MCTRDERRRRSMLRLERAGETVQFAEFATPPEDVAPTVTARHAAVPSDREEYATTRFDKLVGDLAPGGAGSDDHHGTIRKISGVAVLAGVQLRDIEGQLAMAAWQARALIRP